MHLHDIYHRDPPEESGRYGQAIRQGRKTGSPVPGIYYLFAARPALAGHMGNLMQDLMRGPGEIPPGRRELIAAWTSARNDCLF